jgi:hypothetical protein
MLVTSASILTRRSWTIWKLASGRRTGDRSWDDLLVDEAARAQERLPLGVVELLAQEEVVGGERAAELGGDRGGHGISGSASGSAIAR